MRNEFDELQVDVRNELSRRMNEKAIDVVQTRARVARARELLGDNPLSLKERLVEEGILSLDHPVTKNGLPELQPMTLVRDSRDYSYIYYLPDEKQGVLLAQLSPLERAECELASAEELLSDTANNFDPFMQLCATREFIEAGVDAMAPEIYVVFHLQADLRTMQENQSQKVSGLGSV
ncbi:MAG: hypothetical protein HYV40_02475 [Candidatus Levybacteria bacterium]|nr:hypothetical protein [Candidatus Levybacteria bacterium]